MSFAGVSLQTWIFSTAVRASDASLFLGSVRYDDISALIGGTVYPIWLHCFVYISEWPLYWLWLATELRDRQKEQQAEVYTGPE
jgi:hypothetical protein